jgi:glycosyltransferase involved in cell wall biosynthesis
MTTRDSNPTDIGNGAMYAPPLYRDGAIYRGVLSCNGPEVLKYLHRDLWVVLHLDHHAGLPPDMAHIDMYQIDPFFGSRLHGKPCVHAIVRDFVDPALFRPLGVQKKFDVIFNGAWTPVKRHELFIDGLVFAKQHGRALTAMMMGYHWEGYTRPHIENSVRESIDRHGLAVEIMETDWDFDQVNARYNLCSCAVHTSSREAGPQILPEATLAGLPYLATSDTFGGSPAYVSVENGNGLTFDPSPEAMAKAVWWALDNKDKFAPRKWALQNMSKPVGEQRLRAALADLASRTGWRVNIAGIEGTDDMDYAGVFEAEEAVLAAIGDGGRP